VSPVEKGLSVRMTLFLFLWNDFYHSVMTLVDETVKMKHLFSILSINDFCEKAQFSFMQNYKVLFFRQINTDYFEQLPAFCAIHCLLII